MTNLFNSRLAHLELNVAQFGLLAAVGKMPGSTLAAIGEAMLLDESTLARNFTVLERRGLIQAEGGRGRGGKQLNLTRTGKRVATASAVIWRETNRLLVEELGVEEAEAGRSFLRALGAASERLKAEDEAAANRKVRRPQKVSA